MLAGDSPDKGARAPFANSLGGSAPWRGPSTRAPPAQRAPLSGTSRTRRGAARPRPHGEVSRPRGQNVQGVPASQAGADGQGPGGRGGGGGLAYADPATARHPPAGRGRGGGRRGPRLGRPHAALGGNVARRDRRTRGADAPQPRPRRGRGRAAAGPAEVPGAAPFRGPPGEGLGSRGCDAGGRESGRGGHPVAGVGVRGPRLMGDHRPRPSLRVRPASPGPRRSHDGLPHLGGDGRPPRATASGPGVGPEARGRPWPRGGRRSAAHGWLGLRMDGLQRDAPGAAPTA